MARSPINHCIVCGQPIIRMRKVYVTSGRFKGQYTLEWSRAVYCSHACHQIAYRRRKKQAQFYRVFGTD